MKRIALVAVFAGAMTFAACNNTANKTEDAHEVEHTHDHAHDGHDHAEHLLADAEAAYNKAKADLDAAVASGDEKAEESARKALARSEEHTSELQSRENLVCRLLLEKKKKKKK